MISLVFSMLALAPLLAGQKADPPPVWVKMAEATLQIGINPQRLVVLAPKGPYSHIRFTALRSDLQVDKLIFVLKDGMRVESKVQTKVLSGVDRRSYALPTLLSGIEQIELHAMVRTRTVRPRFEIWGQLQGQPTP
jgi:hypothetical protein